MSSVQKLNAAAAQRTRQTVASLLQGKLKKQSRAQVLRFAAAQVLLLEHDRSPMQQLLRFCYALSALEWHAEGGGLSEKNADVLTAHARSILAGLGVARERSKLGNLHGELEACLALIAKTRGRPWESALRADRAYVSAMRASQGRDGGLSLAWADAALRLGDATEALTALKRAQADGLPESRLVAALALKLRCFRLAQRTDAFAATVAELTPEARAEPSVQWEILTEAAARSGDFRPLAVATHRGKPHYACRTICLATLYNLAGDRLIDRAVTQKIETVIRRRDLTWAFESPLVEFARLADRLAETDSDEHEAQEALTLAMESAARCPTVEEELLIFGVAARFMARSQDFRLASLALGRYRALSWSLSEGRGVDALGVAGSLLERSWFHDARSA